MDISSFNTDDTQEVINLFTTVFSNSEGRDEGLLIGELVKDLITTTDAKELLGFVAIDQDNIIGCIFFSRLSFDSISSDNNAFNNNAKAYILSPVAVHTEHQGQGVGQQLISFGINHLKDINAELVFTYGDPKFYSKLGFTHISEETIKAPLKLTYPEGWLAQSLTSNIVKPISGASHCVDALNKQVYW